MAVSSFSVSAGASCATGRVSWGGGQAARDKVPWLPPMRVAPVLSDGRGGWRWNPDVYRALQWLFEEYIGGINAPTASAISTTITQTQADVADTIAYAAAVSNYAQGIAATSSATAEVTQNAGLSGSGSIPEPPEPPIPPGGHAV